MEWTANQIAEMRHGRPTYGDSQKGGAVTWLVTGKDTDGEYSLLYGEAKPDYSVFPHYHTLFTESFQVLEGSLMARAGDQIVSMNPGDEVSVPPRTVHAWTTGKDGPTRIIVELRPANDGLEKWLLMLQNMHADGLTKPDQQPNSFVHAALFLTESDTHPAGRARALNPVFKLVAWLARRAGVDRRLKERYLHPSRGDVAAT